MSTCLHVADTLHCVAGTNPTYKAIALQKRKKISLPFLLSSLPKKRRETVKGCVMVATDRKSDLQDPRLSPRNCGSRPAEFFK